MALRGTNGMSKKIRSDLKSEVVKFLKERGAHKVGVANPFFGFEQAVKSCRPLDLMKNAKSVIVFAVYIDGDYYRTVKIEGRAAQDDRIGNIFRDWLAFELAEFMKAKGFNALVPSGHFDRDRKIAAFSFKLAAHEAGVGVFGKSGVIITPEYGPRVNIGVVITDAFIEPNEKLIFTPCQNCHICASVCPANAIRDDLDPPLSHNRDKCVNFVQRLRNETSQNKFFCGYCYDKCPVGKTSKRGFTISTYKRLENLKPKEREKLIRKGEAKTHDCVHHYVAFRLWVKRLVRRPNESRHTKCFSTNLHN
jgi:epoxyqueuosine reductase QueG